MMSKCEKCGVEVYMKDWGNGGKITTEVDGDKTHYPERCLQNRLNAMAKQLGSAKDKPMNIPDFNDDNYEEILKAADATVEYSDEFVDGHNNVSHIPEFGHWSLMWKYGLIGFESMSIKKEDEIVARKAAALFIYLWNKGVAADIADRAAEAYVQYWNIRNLDY